MVFFESSTYSTTILTTKPNIHDLLDSAHQFLGIQLATKKIYGITIKTISVGLSLYLASRNQEA
jgi:hypothetical protein